MVSRSFPGQAARLDPRARVLYWLHSHEPGEGPEVETEAELRDQTPGVGGLPLRILVIEDNRDYADGLCTVFELYGHQATTRYDGILGLEAALQAPPDVIVCDIGLPGMDGYEIARALRANPRTAQVCLVAVTGYGSARDRELTGAAGFDAHLTKPAEAAEILAVVAATGLRRG
jgi:CheY-like chemotaxis protein